MNDMNCTRKKTRIYTYINHISTENISTATTYNNTYKGQHPKQQSKK